MKCLILATGYATRLYPLAENFPKPLLKVQGKTILDWLIDDIEQSGMVEKPEEPEGYWCYLPFYFYTRENAKLIQKGIDVGCGTDALESYITWLSTQVPVHAVEITGRR